MRRLEVAVIVDVCRHLSFVYMAIAPTLRLAAMDQNTIDRPLIEAYSRG
jgi:hypothetical protein